jgi:uncharacterized membrane protein YkoI
LPKLAIDEATALAFKVHPGTITDQKLERKKGGSGLRYSFEAKNGTVTQEVGVEAQAGQVLQNKQEGPNPD